MTDVKALADGLSEAQREDVSHPGNEVAFWSNDGRVAKALQRKGLIGPLDYAWRAKWTSLGLAVRAELARRQKEAPDAQ